MLRNPPNSTPPPRGSISPRCTQSPHGAAQAVRSPLGLLPGLAGGALQLPAPCMARWPCRLLFLLPICSCRYLRQAGSLLPSALPSPGARRYGWLKPAAVGLQQLCCWFKAPAVRFARLAARYPCHCYVGKVRGCFLGCQHLVPEWWRGLEWLGKKKPSIFLSRMLKRGGVLWCVGAGKLCRQIEGSLPIFSCSFLNICFLPTVRCLAMRYNLGSDFRRLAVCVKLLWGLGLKT